MFFLGIILGYLIAITTIAVTYLIIFSNKHTVTRTLNKIEQKIPLRKEKMSVLKRPTESEEAYKHILNLNKDRGGIPDNEL